MRHAKGQKHARSSARKTSRAGQRKLLQKDLQKTEIKKISLTQVWKDFWAYAGPVFTVIAASTYWMPAVAISTGANLDPRQNLQTQFVITNIGHVNIYNLKFTCTEQSLVARGEVTHFVFGGNEPLSPVAVLHPGQPVSKGCYAQSNSNEMTRLQVVTWFEWPLIHHQDKAIAYFDVRRGPDGFLLVPAGDPTSPPFPPLPDEAPPD